MQVRLLEIQTESNKGAEKKCMGSHPRESIGEHQERYKRTLALYMENIGVTMELPRRNHQAK